MDRKNKINKKATGHRLYRLIEESKMTYAEIAEYLDLQSPRVIYEWVSLKLLSGCDLFFKEYCELMHKGNYNEGHWNYGRYFLNIVMEQMELMTNSLGLPWYI